MGGGESGRVGCGGWREWEGRVWGVERVGG